MAKSKYQKAKEDFLKIEKPHDKLNRLHCESNQTWEIHQIASDAERDFIKNYEDELQQYDSEMLKVKNLVTTFDERMDSMTINPPKIYDYGVDDYPF